MGRINNWKFLALAMLGVSGFAFGSEIDTKESMKAMMRIYNNPALAPQVDVCKKNINCNAFVSLSNQWKNIESSYRYRGFNIKEDARKGDGYGLNKGFNLYADRSYEIRDAGDAIFYASGSKSKKSEAFFAKGLAVLLYIEDKNGWIKE